MRIINIIAGLLLLGMPLISLGAEQINPGLDENTLPAQKSPLQCMLAGNDSIVPLDAGFRGCCSGGTRACDCFRDWVVCCDTNGSLTLSMCKCN